MIRTLGILFFLLPLSVLAQNRISKSKSDLKKELDQYVLENSSNKPKLVETDSTLSLSLDYPTAPPVTFVYGFDKTGKCDSEKTIAACNSCFKKLLKAVLDQKIYQWKKINENQYVSKFADRLLIELPIEKKDYHFTIFRAEWTKELYDLLIKN